MTDQEPRFEGLPMSRPPDPAALERERAWLRGLEKESGWKRGLTFLKHGGPAYMQSAITLGGGSAAAGRRLGEDLARLSPRRNGRARAQRRRGWGGGLGEGKARAP